MLIRADGVMSWKPGYWLVFGGVDNPAGDGPRIDLSLVREKPGRLQDDPAVPRRHLRRGVDSTSEQFKKALLSSTS
jgi:hypothetical protein